MCRPSRRDVVSEDQKFYDDHVNKTGLTATKRLPKGSGGKTPAWEWVVRNGKTELKDGALRVAPSGKQNPFIAFPRLNIPGPAVATARVRSEKGGNNICIALETCWSERLPA